MYGPNIYIQIFTFKTVVKVSYSAAQYQQFTGFKKDGNVSTISVTTLECIEYRKDNGSSVCYLSKLLNKTVYILKAIQPKELGKYFINSYETYFKYY